MKPITYKIPLTNGISNIFLAPLFLCVCVFLFTKRLQKPHTEFSYTGKVLYHHLHFIRNAGRCTFYKNVAANSFHPLFAQTAGA